ncbi:MAG TPA: tetratricopeptide repeat protein [Terriglobales bacterium]|nr:tetratricopeptide repeat protein [Terriglobales bacterium]
MQNKISLTVLLFVSSQLIAQAGAPAAADPFSMRDLQQPVYISGQVTLSDGRKITEPVAIETVCSDRQRIETYSDSSGNFSFEVKTKPEMMNQQTADLSNFGGGTFSKDTGGSWQSCSLLPVLVGFTAEAVPYMRVMSVFQSTNFGKLILKPIGDSESLALSVTSLAAPDGARKAMVKAREQMEKKKPDEARKSLQKAVEIYPQYAAAWSELGRLQYQGRDRAAAQHSFEQALAADPKYAKPYLWLAQIGVDSQQWDKVVDTTGKLLALNATSFPGAWFLNATAQYNLQNFDAAEHSAREGMKGDPDHRIPRLEYLLGLTLAKKSDFNQAAEHIRAFLQTSKNPAEIDEAKAQLAQIEQLLSSEQKPAR